MDKSAIARAACALALAGTVLAGCHKPQPTAAQRAEANRAASTVGTKDSVLDALGKTNGLGTFARLVKEAGLSTALGGVGDYTLLAPTDAAWAKLPDDRRKALESKEGRAQLLAMLRSHTVSGYVMRQDLDKALARSGGAVTLATMGGAPVRVHRDGTALLFGPGDTGPRLAGDPVAGRNGVIYPIDQVLPPPPGPAGKRGATPPPRSTRP